MTSGRLLGYVGMAGDKWETLSGMRRRQWEDS